MAGELSNQGIASAAAASLRQWLATDPMIPLWRGRPNRSAICKALHISRSCVRTNPQLANIFDALDRRFRQAGINRSSHQACSPLESRIAELEEELATLRQRLSAFEYLLQVAERS